MRDVMGGRDGGVFLGIVLVLIVCLAAFSTAARAQNPGNNAVFPMSGLCCQGSSAFIDASVFVSGTNPNICAVLHNILGGVGYPAAGAIIDARGISGTAALTCTASPWAGISNPPPSTILLPATGGASPTPIVISSTWVLPANTHLIGEGDGIASSGSTPGTTIQAATSFAGSMIQFGSSSVCPSGVCTGISVENLTLDGQGQSINGITNGFSRDFSSVDHVSLYRIRGTGLLIEGSATDSGPYSNITFDTGGSAGVASTVCADILNAGGTRGIQQLSCKSETNDASAAVLLDSSNNSIEDVTIAGFYNGILVGSQAPAQSNVLVNITDDTKHTCNPVCPPINTIHIASYTTNGEPNVTDLSIMGASNDGMGTTTIADDLTGTYLFDPTVGIYALGESANGGYSRYTTSPNAATWAVGASYPQGTCARGSLYSCIGGGTGTTCSSNALWACALSGSTVGWLPVD